MTIDEIKAWLSSRGFLGDDDLKRLLPSVSQPWITTSAMFEAASAGKLEVCRYIAENGAPETGYSFFVLTFSTFILQTTIFSSVQWSFAPTLERHLFLSHVTTDTCMCPSGLLRWVLMSGQLLQDVFFFYSDLCFFFSAKRVCDDAGRSPMLKVHKKNDFFIFHSMMNQVNFFH